jgi:hypothetical protein
MYLESNVVECDLVYSMFRVIMRYESLNYSIYVSLRVSNEDCDTSLVER